MPNIPFGEWLPDQADLLNPGVLTAKNVLPSASGYLPVGTLTPVTDALDARPRGAFQARDKDGNVYQYAGDAAKLYENDGGSWGDVSVGGGYSTGADERWEFTQWKNKILAVNYSDNPQQITMGGTNFSNLTTVFKARHITVIRDFVVMANTFDSTDDAVPDRVRWSAFNDETDYTVSASTLSDFQDLKTGEVSRIFGGEFGVILQPNSVWRMTFVGAPTVFQFDEVLPGIGVIAPGAAVREGDAVYFLSTNGFYELRNGTQPRPIGKEKIDRYVLDDLDNSYLSRISATVEANGQRVFFAYPGSGNTDGRPNRVVVYDRVLDRWSLIEEEIEFIWRGGEVGLTLEQLDNVNASLDALPASLDSSRWVGGAAQLAAFDSDFKSGFFDGTNMTATILSREMELIEGRTARINGYSPLIDGGTVTSRIATRNRLVDTESYGSSLTLSSTGKFRTRSNARFHRFEFTLTDSWTQAMGLQVAKDDIAMGDGRG